MLLPALVPLIEQCWDQRPDSRPDIADLRRDVERIQTLDSSRDRRDRPDVIGGMILERGDRSGSGSSSAYRGGGVVDERDREGDDGMTWDTVEKSSLSSSSSSSTVSIVLPKMAAPSGVATYVYLDVCAFFQFSFLFCFI